MSEKNMRECSCVQDEEKNELVLRIDSVKKTCCENHITELNNSNTLQKVNEEIGKLNLSSSIYVETVPAETLLSYHKSYIGVNKPPLKLLTDIPVTNSSLLI